VYSAQDRNGDLDDGIDFDFGDAPHIEDTFSDSDSEDSDEEDHNIKPTKT
jgi:hypothetical protein